MTRNAWTLALAALAAAIAISAFCGPARADKSFRDEFIAKYAKPDGKDPKDQAFAAACEKAKCNICHEGKSKKDRNRYGAALGKLLNREKDKDNKEKIQAALDKVAKLKLDPKDEKSPTFGDLIKAGKLPGGEPKEAAKKPVATLAPGGPLGG